MSTDILVDGPVPTGQTPARFLQTVLRRESAPLCIGFFLWDLPVFNEQVFVRRPV